MTVVYSPSAPPDIEVERQIRVELARRNPVFFAQHYLRVEEGERFEFAEFQVEMMEVCASDEERVLFLEPAAHGKTTIVAKAYPLWLCCCFPNVRIKLGSKNSDDAEARLYAIKQELENNELLIEDFGRFVSDKWRDKEINVAQRTVRDIEPTIRAFGSESSIIGSRATHLILDDIVTELNSGAHIEDATRRKMSTNFHTTFKKVGYPRRKLYIRWVNTVVDLRDLVHECATVNGRMPDDNRTRWRSTKNFVVVHRRALDEERRVPLWPEAHTVESLEQEKREDLMSFLKRMQNRCLDPDTMPFRPEWFRGDPAAVPPLPGAFDLVRSLGQLPPRPADAPRLALAAGYDPNPGTSENSKYSAYAELAFDKSAPEPRCYYITDLHHFRATLPDQERFIVDRAMARGTALTLVESNVANQWLLQLPGIQGAVKAGYRIEPHHTSAKNKPDPETGIPSIAAMVRAGLLRFPYADERSREQTELAVSEFLTYPEGATSDLLMAIWFAILAAKQVSVRKGLRVYGGVLPEWADRGVTVASIDRYYPTVGPNN